MTQEATGDDAQHFTLFTAVKNEAPFLLEWIAYHKVIGFDRIAIVSNPSSDMTNELLDALAGAGEIIHTVTTVPEGVAPQAVAAKIANEGGFIRKGDWAIWLDADEFLNIHVGDGFVTDMVRFLGPRQAIIIPWRIFGDSGNQAFSGRFISNSFSRAAALESEVNLKVKTFFRMSDAVLGLSGHSVHRPLLSGTLPIGSFAGCDGQELRSSNRVHRKWVEGLDRSRASRIPPEEISYDVAQINHYCVRTPEHFALKRIRGRGWAAAQAGASNKRHNAEFYVQMNRNDCPDQSILRHEDAVTAEIQRLMSIQGLGELQQEALRRVAAQLNEATATHNVPDAVS
ncbi:glycosyltransferase family 2 protein [Paracoccus sp. (in: a-proteobacteria)]|uniref:glycosyltransferase family 2 protein n=1 Tax=Paracoccus sp. TaxID=267 RepID=UPI0026E04C7C|nr:glycosyltransferase family 2 protein [Paracoccus sp. (in: a-proteobacteria)]MDO5369573.1 glycosyltransferase family 2 protein [Paracoccus sp. (in: a-proteobacteria)]